MSEVSHDSETPAQGQQVITAVAFIHSEFDGVTKLFLPRRAKTKKFLSGEFELPGGHIEFGEELEVGLAREVQEEFGMKISIGDVIDAFTYSNEVKGSHTVELIYFAKFLDPIENIKLNLSDHSEFKWVSRDELVSAYSERKDMNDDEWVSVRKGFSILEGEGHKLS